MEHRRPQLFFLIILIGGSLIGGWYLLQGRNGSRGNALQASGTVEAVEVEVAAELGGVVLEVMVAEADRVEAGQVLVRLDDRMLQAQFDQAEAVLAAAQASYDLAQANAEQADVRQQAMITAAALRVDQCPASPGYAVRIGGHAGRTGPISPGTGAGCP